MSSKMKFFIHTTGCKANQWDSYIITNSLKGTGHSPGSISNADFIVINACTLTEGAERDLRRFINRSRGNSGARIILAGCHAQVYPEQSYGADLVLGQEEKFRISEFLCLNGLFVSKTRSIPLESIIADGLPWQRTRVFLKIQDGCDRFCSYCVVPLVTGQTEEQEFS